MFKDCNFEHFAAVGCLVFVVVEIIENCLNYFEIHHPTHFTSHSHFVLLCETKTGAASLVMVIKRDISLYCIVCLDLLLLRLWLAWTIACPSYRVSTQIYNSLNLVEHFHLFSTNKSIYGQQKLMIDLECEC